MPVIRELKSKCNHVTINNDKSINSKIGNMYIYVYILYRHFIVTWLHPPLQPPDYWHFRYVTVKNGYRYMVTLFYEISFSNENYFTK